MAKADAPRFISVKLADIELPNDNPRTISDSEMLKLREDIRKDPDFLHQRPPLINYLSKKKKHVCYAGNQRIKAAIAEGIENLFCWVQNDVPAKLQKERMIKDNLHRGQWDFEKLRELDISFLRDAGFALKDLMKLSADTDKENAKASLSERFIIPPFSVIDTRQGYWQERKKKWFAAGIASHESREDMEVSGSLSGSVPGYYDKKNKVEKILGREISNEEFEAEHLAELMPDKSTLSYTNGGGLLSTFDPVLCEVLYSWFCPKEGSILDPFAGGSVRGLVAGMLDLEYLGVDLRPEQVEANKKQLKEFQVKNVHWMQGDSLDLEVMIDKKIMFDFVFSCPPYFDLEKYSKDDKDLSNMDYERFREVYRQIIFKSMTKLKPNRFACFVVGDIRDKSGFYRDFVSETIAAFTKQPLCREMDVNLYNEIILLNVAGSTPIRAGKQFEKFRKVGKVHQNILVFYKGDPKKIATDFEWLINIEEALKEQHYEPNIAMPNILTE